MAIRTSTELKGIFGTGQYPSSIDYSDLVDTVFSQGGSIINSTDDVAEGSSNLYFTNARSDARIALSNIGDLANVSISSPTSGQALTYNGSSWVNATPASTLNSLTDVVLSSLSAGDVVIYNGTNWVNQAALELDVTLASVSDVTLTSEVAGQTLVYNGTNWENATVESGGGFETQFLLMGA